jgi:hypothetical protein
VDIAREIRRRSKFGCVMCRCAIYQYEHIDPEFADAREHDPNAICLLCGGCHDRVTRGRLSKETVKAKYLEIQNSQDIARPFEELDLATDQISVVLGSAKFEYVQCLLRINGDDILTISPPKDGAAFPTINGVFCDCNGREIFRIAENVWEGPVDAWDVQISGTRLTIKADEHRITLALEVQPPNTVRVLQLDMYRDNCHIVCDEGQTIIGQVYGAACSYIGLGNFVCRGGEAGISVDSRSGTPPRLAGIRMVGGEGIFLDGTGIKIGVGAGSMHIAQMRVWANDSQPFNAPDLVRKAARGR